MNLSLLLILLCIFLIAICCWVGYRFLQVQGKVAFLQERIHNLELQFSQREEELTSSEEELRQSFESQGKMMEEIQLKEISLSALINNTTDFIYSLDTKFCLVEFNDSVKDFYSKLGIELTKGKSAYDFISQKNIHEAIKVFNKVLEGHSEIAVIEAKDAKGNIVYFESSYNPIRNEKKENIGISVMIREITERIKSERKIKTSEEKFSKAFRSSPDSALITTVQELRILECNDGFLAFSGYTREEVEAKTMIELGFWDLEERNKLKEILLTNGEVIEMEVHLKIKSGAIRTCLISAEALELNNELCMISMTRDITEKKLAEENIRKKNNELLELTNLMVDYKLMALRSAMNPHFLFNVMNSIQYFIAKNEKENALKYLAVFSKLIRNILTSSIENKTSLKHEIETLSNYIELEILRFEKKFSVQYEIDESIDLNAIEIPSLLLQPYVENAILHGLHNKTNGNGLLKIQIKMQEENLLKFIIEDNGVGREESAKIKLESQLDHKSVGMRLTKERLDIINRRNNITVEVIDLFNENNEASGTRIQIFIEC